MNHFYDYSLLVVLNRMPGLQFLRFIFKEEIEDELRHSENEGEGPESSGCQLAVNRQRYDLFCVYETDAVNIRPAISPCTMRNSSTPFRLLTGHWAGCI